MRFAEALVCMGVWPFLWYYSVVYQTRSMCCAANWASLDICVAFYRLDVKTHSMAQACPSAESQGVQPASPSVQTLEY